MATPIPTREQIQSKIDEIKQDPTFSTIRTDLIEQIAKWLDQLNLSATVIFGEEVNPKEKILEDLDSYNF